MPTPRGTRQLMPRPPLLPSPPRQALLQRPCTPRLFIRSGFHSRSRSPRPLRGRFSDRRRDRSTFSPLRSGFSSRRDRSPLATRRRPSRFRHHNDYELSHCSQSYFPRNVDSGHLCSSPQISGGFRHRKSPSPERSGRFRNSTGRLHPSPPHQNRTYKQKKGRCFSPNVSQPQEYDYPSDEWISPSVSEFSVPQIAQKHVTDWNRTGIVANYKASEGFGFITVNEEDGKMKIEANLFVHHTGLKVPSLTKGEVVKFDVAQGLKDLEAINVRYNSQDELETTTEDFNEHFGEVIEYDLMKKFGIIKCFSSGNTLIAHHSRILPPLEKLNSGQLVKFNIVIGPKGPCADRIQLANDPVKSVKRGKFFRRYTTSSEEDESSSSESV